MIGTVQHTGFEHYYFLLRKKEGRVYSDDEVKELPLVSLSHPLRKEWAMRKESCNRLVRYFTAMQRPLNILEVGCGNGWLCNQLAAIPGAIVTGLDKNEAELKQAARVFPFINFIYSDRIDFFGERKFDAIVFAASFQYFRSAKEILQSSICCLKEKGEVQILDTHFYSNGGSAEAMARSNEYFASLGFPQMSGFYFHHTMDDLDGFNHDVLYNPKKTFNKLFNKNPFPWIRIKK